MHVYESIPIVASLGILFLFALYVGLYHALFGALLGAVHRTRSRNVTLSTVPVIWVAVELARARVTSFPWDLLGYTQVDNLFLTKLAPLTGVMGLSFVVACVNAMWLMRPATNSSRRTHVWSYAAATIAIGMTGIGLLYKPKFKEHTQALATLVQENLGVGSERGAFESKQQMIASFSQLSLHPAIDATGTVPVGDHSVTRSQLIVWPEAPTDFVDSDPLLREAMSRLAIQTRSAVIVNDVTLASASDSGQQNLYNSASFYQPDGSYAGRYNKMHLVPFGEYTPYKPLFFFVGHLLDDLVFVPGTVRTLFTTGGKRFGVFICYESIFGDDLRQFARDGAQALVNISDDGWYGDTSAPWEHLDMVRMRAIENRRWVVRATNTGITAAIDPLGRVTAMIPRHERTSVQVAFGYRSDLTLYSRYGDWLGWGCGMATVVLLIAGQRRVRFTAQEAVN
jgi:apolipoprotein N-acyltransferase